MNAKRLLLTTVTVATLAPACVLEPDIELASETHELSASTKIIHNFNGDERYVRVNANEVKLFMSRAAEAANDPRRGFRNSNHFKDSCGPTAAMNVFNWYGIVELEGKHCYWHSEPEVSVPPIWVCRDRVTASTLGLQMNTNNWSVATVPMPGTSTANLRKVFKKYVERYMPADYDYRYEHSESNAQVQYNALWATLAQGNPVIVVHKTGSNGGHFSTIVGIEKAGSPSSIFDDKIIMANPSSDAVDGAMTFSTFRNLWRRDYADFGALALVGERRYTRVSLWDSTGAPPAPPSGGGSGSTPGGPISQK